MIPFDWLIHSGGILVRSHKILESDSLWTKWAIPSGQEFTKKINFLNFNFIILLLHLQKPFVWIWAVHSNLYSEESSSFAWCQSVFAPLRNKFEKISLETKHVKNPDTSGLWRYYVISMATWLFFSQLSKANISCCCTLAAGIQSIFYELNFCFYCIHPCVFLLLSYINISAKSHLAIFKVLLFLHSTLCFQFLYSEYRTVWWITQWCSIFILFAPS